MTSPGAEEASGLGMQRSFGPSQPETMGLAVGGFLCIFLRKYISCVLTIGGGRRYSVVGLFMCPSWYMALTV